MATSEGKFTIELRRCIDNLVYHYEPGGARNGRPSWKRVDMDLYLYWSEHWGWVIGDVAGTISGRPWDVEKGDQTLLPPDGIWVSRKGPKSYVYEHKNMGDGTARALM